ncbi:MAG: sulfite exporter TauE/SafE family protein [Kofleriaceae bacterium]
MTTPTLAATLALTMVAGGVLGMLGGGGSILCVPILLYVARLPPDEAIATSLVVVGTTSALGAAVRLRARQVHVRVGLAVGGFGMLGAVVGARLGALVPPAALVYGFIAIMAMAGLAMLRPRRDVDAEPDPPARPHVALGAVLGTAVGMVTGLVGAGSFLIVPALTLAAALPIGQAIGTAMMVMALQASAALAGKLDHVHVDARLATALTVAAVAGMLVGSRLAGRLAPATLRRGFGGFLLVVASVMIIHLLAAGGGSG